MICNKRQTQFHMLFFFIETEVVLDYQILFCMHTRTDRANDNVSGDYYDGAMHDEAQCHNLKS